MNSIEELFIDGVCYVQFVLQLLNFMDKRIYRTDILSIDNEWDN